MLPAATVPQFETSIVGGRGYVALAAVVFGGWTLRGSLPAASSSAVLSMRLWLQAHCELNARLVASLPFVVTLAAMAVFARAGAGPAALGRGTGPGLLRRNGAPGRR
ncbi:MAG: hypothetical protein R2695_14310 [Acidimicrobiales bacterium]